MAAHLVAAARSSPNRCNFLFYLVIFNVVLVCKSSSLESVRSCPIYSREKLIDIGLRSFIPPPPPPTDIPEELLRTTVPAWIITRNSQHCRRRRKKKKRGKRGGILTRLKNCPHKPPLPSLILSNTQALTNKIDELRLRISTQKWTSCALLFTETWLNTNIPDSPADLYPGPTELHTPARRKGEVCVLT